MGIDKKLKLNKVFGRKVTAMIACTYHSINSITAFSARNCNNNRLNSIQDELDDQLDKAIHTNKISKIVQIITNIENKVENVKESNTKETDINTLKAIKELGIREKVIAAYDNAKFNIANRDSIKGDLYDKYCDRVHDMKREDKADLLPEYSHLADYYHQVIKDNHPYYYLGRWLAKQVPFLNNIIHHDNQSISDNNPNPSKLDTINQLQDDTDYHNLLKKAVDYYQIVPTRYVISHMSHTTRCLSVLYDYYHTNDSVFDIITKYFDILTKTSHRMSHIRGNKKLMATYNQKCNEHRFLGESRRQAHEYTSAEEQERAVKDGVCDDISIKPVVSNSSSSSNNLSSLGKSLDNANFLNGLDNLSKLQPSNASSSSTNVNSNQAVPIHKSMAQSWRASVASSASTESKSNHNQHN